MAVVKTIPRLRLAAIAFALAGAMGLFGVGTAVQASAQPAGPFPQWCPGDFWDPLWGDNWDGGHCHDNWRGPGPNPHPGPPGPGFGPPGPGGPGWH